MTPMKTLSDGHAERGQSRSSRMAAKLIKAALGYFYALEGYRT
jgi:hypothetical protein